MLKVIALCDGLGRALKYWRRIGSIPGIEMHLVVANSTDRALGRTFASHAKYIVTNGLSAALLSGSLIFRRRVRFFASNMNGQRITRHIASLHADVGLHGAGCIYKEAIIGALRLGILNAHIGLLPQYRGRSVMEWSLLELQRTGVTVFFIDTGIDTGARVVVRREIDVSGFPCVAAAKTFLFDCDAVLYEDALRILLEPGKALEIQRADEGRRYFVMSQLFVGVVERLLRPPS